MPATVACRVGCRAVGISVLALAACAGSAAHAQLRVATWNVSTYTGPTATRDPAFASVLFDTFVPSPGDVRQFNPDILVVLELSSNATALNGFLTMMNNRAGANTYAVSPLLTGPDSVTALYYKRSKVSFVAGTVISTGGGAPLPPRNTNRFRVRPIGYAGSEADLYIYATHMKADTTDSDEARRLVEAQNIRTNAQGLPTDANFIVLGDFNMQGSIEPPVGQPFGAFTWLTQSQTNNNGRFFDPISTPGVGVNGLWHTQSSMRFVHTQSPGAGSGMTPPGMDDRFDFILVSAELIDRVGTTNPGRGLEYIGNFPTPYSTTTWNDPNHSFRAWGNDGTKYNVAINNGGTNTMVGPTIANALFNAAAGDAAGGHIPVFMDLRVPPRATIAGSGITSPLTIDFGQVPQGSLQSRDFTVANSANVALWNAGGINSLLYTLALPTGGPVFALPAGPLTFLNAPGAAANAHSVSLDTTTPGMFTGTITVSSNSSEEPFLTVQITGEVVANQPLCYANCDGSTDVPVLGPADFSCYLARYRAGDEYANCDGSTDVPVLGPADFSCFLSKYRLGCP